MHVIRILIPRTIAAIALLLAAGSAMAQMYPGQDVTVNPNAIPQSAPSQAFPGFVLHKPWRHHHRRVAPKVATVAPAAPAAPAAADTSDQSLMSTDSSTAPPANTAPPPTTARPAAKPKPQAAKPVQAATPPASDLVPFNFGDDQTLAAPTSKVATSPAPPVQSPKPGKGDALDAGLAKRGAIIFEHNSTDPQPSQLNGIKLLAGDLNSAIEAGATQVQLQAFAGAPGDKSSEAKRISLKRALAVRQLLIDGGVPSSRIVTRAMGGATDNGEPDRVDIYVRAS